mgnify:CR=1 FL=1
MKRLALLMSLALPCGVALAKLPALSDEAKAKAAFDEWTAAGNTLSAPITLQFNADAGHEPVVVGGLARAREFDYGTPVFGRPMTAAELRKALGLNP